MLIGVQNVVNSVSDQKLFLKILCKMTLHWLKTVGLSLLRLIRSNFEKYSSM